MPVRGWVVGEDEDKYIINTIQAGVFCIVRWMGSFIWLIISSFFFRRNIASSRTNGLRTLENDLFYLC